MVAHQVAKLSAQSMHTWNPALVPVWHRERRAELIVEPQCWAFRQWWCWCVMQRKGEGLNHACVQCIVLLTMCGAFTRQSAPARYSPEPFGAASAVSTCRSKRERGSWDDASGAGWAGSAAGAGKEASLGVCRNRFLSWLEPPDVDGTDAREQGLGAGAGLGLADGACLAPESGAASVPLCPPVQTGVHGRIIF